VAPAAGIPKEQTRPSTFFLEVWKIHGKIHEQARRLFKTPGGAGHTRRGSSKGASLTASLTALLRVPGGAEVPVRGFGVREG
jgi:hypothetical protein